MHISYLIIETWRRSHTLILPFNSRINHRFILSKESWDYPRHWRFFFRNIKRVFDLTKKIHNNNNNNKNSRGENFRNDLVTVTFVPLFGVSNCHQQTRIKRQLNTFVSQGGSIFSSPDGMRDSKIKINRPPRNFEHGICIGRRVPRRIIQISFFLLFFFFSTRALFSNFTGAPFIISN